MHTSNASSSDYLICISTNEGKLPGAVIFIIFIESNTHSNK